jgi:hypothetical protein
MSDDSLDPIGTPDEPLTTGPVLPEADDAFVAGLLASTGADLPPVPSDIAARWDAAIAEAAAERADADSPVAASTTVIPMQPTRSRAPRGLRLAGIAASVAALALVGGVVANQFVVSTSDDTVITEASGSLPTTDKVTTSGTTFAAESAEEQASALVGRATGAAPQEPTIPLSAKETVPATSGLESTSASATTQSSEVDVEPEIRAFVDDTAQRQACVENLAQRKGVKPVAVDMGYYQGEPAAMVVLPAEGDATKVDVFIVGTDCNLIDADVQYFTRVDVTD